MSEVQAEWLRTEKAIQHFITQPLSTHPRSYAHRLPRHHRQQQAGPARPAGDAVRGSGQPVHVARSRCIKRGEEPVDADGKSVMQMIILAATEGTPLRIEADGEDAEDAVKKLAELFESKFGEE